MLCILAQSLLFPVRNLFSLLAVLCISALTVHIRVHFYLSRLLCIFTGLQCKSVPVQSRRRFQGLEIVLADSDVER
jgi:hypothetical protein